MTGKGMSRKDYNSRYYEQNKERINKRRRRKYHLDREYSEKCKKQSRESYRRRMRQDGKVDRTVILVDGEYFYTTGYFREITGREPTTIRTLQRNGIIPEATNVNDSGWRLYNENQKDLVAQLFQKYDNGEIRNLREFTPYMEEHWED